MKFNSAVVLAFAAAASAIAYEKRDADPSAAEASFLAALPASIQQVLATNIPAAESIIASEITNPTGAPAWFTALPTDVQNWAVTGGAALASQAAGSATGSGANVAPTGGANSTAMGNSTVTAKTTSTATGSKTGSSGGTSSSKGSASTAGASSSSSSGVASLPSAVVGAGLAGALGIVGMLAL